MKMFLCTRKRWKYETTNSFVLHFHRSINMLYEILVFVNYILIEVKEKYNEVTISIYFTEFVMYS